MRLLRFVIQSLLWAYVASIFAWVVIRAWVGDRSFFVAILGYLGVWLFSPTLVFLSWALLRDWKRTVLALMVPGALFVWFYGPLLMPKPGPRSIPVAPVTMLTFNVRYLNTDIDALAETLLGSGADIVALQEATRYHQENLASRLALRYPYSHHQPGIGLAVHSRYPIVGAKLLPLEPWPAQSLVIEAGESSFHLINVHMARAGILSFVMTYDPAFIRAAVDGRESQVLGIQEAIAGTGLPAILACDCNMTDLSSGYELLTSTLQDTYRERGWGLGHTLLIPRGLEIPSRVNVAVQRIDYLFHSPDIQAVDVHPIRGDSGSDHRPLWAQFDLEPPGK
jgi:endonuclease/exonuclease/phosphatase (EEP) superfamily protein YafD